MEIEDDRHLLGVVRRGLGKDADPADVAGQVRLHAPAAGTAQLLESAGRLLAEVAGAGVLEPFLHQPDVSDVLVNGPGPVWIDRGHGAEPTGVRIDDEQALRRLAQRLAATCGRRLDDAVPFVDARMTDGTRLHAVLPPLATQGTTLSLRLPPRRTFTLDDLVVARSLPPAAADVLREVVAARLAYVVTGGTGTGKTTVLSTLLSVVEPSERLVLVEDAAELRPHHPHVVRLETRLPNAEGAGSIDLSVLVRQALRMRPDRLVVGEVRGSEVVDLLAAMNTGHEGGCGTVHANRAEHVPARFEALAIAAGLDRAATHAQLAAGLDVVIALARAPDGTRRVRGVAILESSDGLVQAVPAYAFSAHGCRPGPGAPVL